MEGDKIHCVLLFIIRIAHNITRYTLIKRYDSANGSQEVFHPTVI